MTKRREILLDLVKKEAKFLRNKLTSVEKNRLDFQELNWNSRTGCIYGQATGTCDSQRAMELIVDGCERVFEADWDKKLKLQKLNGKPVLLKPEDRTEKYFSPVEVFISEDDAINNKNLLNYIKGTKKTLQIK